MVRNRPLESRAISNSHFSTNSMLVLLAPCIVAFCDAAIHFAQTNVKVHKVTRIITDCIFPAARLGLNIFCRGRGIATLCEYPATMSFTFDEANPNNWPTVQAFELKFLADLRSAVSVDGGIMILIMNPTHF